VSIREHTLYNNLQELEGELKSLVYAAYSVCGQRLSKLEEIKRLVYEAY
jgi:hypothetical protein